MTRNITNSRMFRLKTSTSYATSYKEHNHNGEIRTYMTTYRNTFLEV